MGIASTLIALAGARLSSLGTTIVEVGACEEAAREAMDLRVEIIAISRMTYQLAATPGKAPDFGAETETLPTGRGDEFAHGSPGGAPRQSR